MTETRNQAEGQRQAALHQVYSFLLTINEQPQAEPEGYTVTTWGARRQAARGDPFGISIEEVM